MRTLILDLFFHHLDCPLGAPGPFAYFLYRYPTYCSLLPFCVGIFRSMISFPFALKLVSKNECVGNFFLFSFFFFPFFLFRKSVFCCTEEMVLDESCDVLDFDLLEGFFSLFLPSIDL